MRVVLVALAVLVCSVSFVRGGVVNEEEPVPRPLGPCPIAGLSTRSQWENDAPPPSEAEATEVDAEGREPPAINDDEDGNNANGDVDDVNDSVCVYLGASLPASAEELEGARRDIAEVVKTAKTTGVSIVFGGRRAGLMGLLAEEATRQGVPLRGVLLDRYMDRENVDGTAQVVHTLEERLDAMGAMCATHVVLHGGLGTLVEGSMLALRSSEGVMDPSSVRFMNSSHVSLRNTVSGMVRAVAPASPSPSSFRGSN